MIIYPNSPQVCGANMIILLLPIELEPPRPQIISITCLIYTTNEKEQTRKRQRAYVAYFYSYQHGNQDSPGSQVEYRPYSPIFFVIFCFYDAKHNKNQDSQPTTHHFFFSND